MILNIQYRFVFYLLLLCTFFCLGGCSKSGSGEANLEDDAYLYVSFHVNGKDPTLRAHDSDAPSVNQDATDREDYIKDVATLLFQTSGEKVLFHKSTSTQFRLRIKAGTYHVVLLANYPSSLDAYFSTNVTYNEVLNKLRDSLFSDLPTQTSSDVYFPMARIYESQTFIEGGTLFHPVPFHPTLEAVEQLAPISSFGQDHQGAQTQTTINLIRACAKMTLEIDGPGKNDVASIVYINAPENYTFAQKNNRGYTIRSSHISFSYAPVLGSEPIKTHIYVPERLFAASETKGWVRDAATGEDYPLGTVNYIQINMNSGRVYKIPVIKNNLRSSDHYLTIARSAEANYNIVRNHWYQYEINIPAEDKEIHLRLRVLPWNLFRLTDSTYDEPDYDAPHMTVDELTDGNTLQTTADDEIPEIRFKLKSPSESTWLATLTNGLNFKFDLSGSYVDRGKAVGDTGSESRIKIKAIKATLTQSRSTEFYLTVNAKEVPFLVTESDGTEHRFYGPGNRLRIVCSR